MNPSTAQACIVIDELVRGGVSHAVLCPGSRNAPLAFALHRADRAGRLRLHVRIDERTAGFVAVGLAAATRSPVCVVVTSGSAVANLGPAVAAANDARVPLIVVSANRPYELIGTGASQTFEQLGYFGEQTRAALTLGVAESEPAGWEQCNAVWRSTTCRVLAWAIGSRSAAPGPVHFDIPFREPLVPDADDHAEAPHGRPNGAAWTRMPLVAYDQPIELDLSKDTLVIAGQGADMYAGLVGLPTVAEPSAVSPENQLHPLAVRALCPQQVVALGRPTLPFGVSETLAGASTEMFALTAGAWWPDGVGNVQAIGTRVVVSGTPSSDWLERCAYGHRCAQSVVELHLQAPSATTGLHVAAAVARTLRLRDQLVLGAEDSFVDMALAGLVPPGVAVHAHRGTDGGYGTLSMAIGAALAYERRTLVLMGIHAFLRDGGGLLIGPMEPRPYDMTIVVTNSEGDEWLGNVDNSCGDGPDFAVRALAARHTLDIQAICRAFDVASYKLDLSDLDRALREPSTGVRVIEVKADRTPIEELCSAVAVAMQTEYVGG